MPTSLPTCRYRAVTDADSRTSVFNRETSYSIPPSSHIWTMSTANFVVETLTFRGVYPRGHPRITLHPTDRLEVVVNKYSPRSNLEPRRGDVSIVLLDR